jgi:Spy/CpxP family protein refolding chaperone
MEEDIKSMEKLQLLVDKIIIDLYNTLTPEGKEHFQKTQPEDYKEVMEVIKKHA